MRLTLRRSAVALVVLPFVLGAAACGKTDTPTTGATQSPGSSATTTASAGQPFKDKASFVAALKAATKNGTTAHLTVDVDTAGEKVTMAGDTKIDASHPAMKMSMEVSGEKVDLVVVDGKVYMQGFPGLAPGKWATIDGSSAVGKQISGALGQADPARMYDQFDKAVTYIKYVGPDTVDGDKAYQYDLTLDTKSMAANLPAGQQGKLPKTIKYTVWVDESNHLRKVVFDILGSSAVMTMSHYGEPVDIKAPPPSDTVKAPM